MIILAWNLRAIFEEGPTASAIACGSVSTSNHGAVDVQLATRIELESVSTIDIRKPSFSNLFVFNKFILSATDKFGKPSKKGEAFLISFRFSLNFSKIAISIKSL